MAELSEASFNQYDFPDIVEIIEKRLNDSGKNWRHVFKALVVLDYLVRNGSEAVVKYAKKNLHIIKTLKEFQYIDDEGRDQGANGMFFIIIYNLNLIADSPCNVFVFV